MNEADHGPATDSFCGRPLQSRPGVVGAVHTDHHSGKTLPVLRHDLLLAHVHF